MFKIIFTLFLSCVALPACANDALATQCDTYQGQAFVLRDAQKDDFNFCRIEFINAAARIGEGCVAIHQDRPNYAKEVLTNAVIFLNFAEKANCKPKDENLTLISNVTTLANSL